MVPCFSIKGSIAVVAIAGHTGDGDGEGHFWIGLSTGKSRSWDVVLRYPWVRKMMAAALQLHMVHGWLPRLLKGGGMLCASLEGEALALYMDPKLMLVTDDLKIGKHLLFSSLAGHHVGRIRLDKLALGQAAAGAAKGGGQAGGAERGGVAGSVPHGGLRYHVLVVDEVPQPGHRRRRRHRVQPHLHRKPRPLLLGHLRAALWVPFAPRTPSIPATLPTMNGFTQEAEKEAKGMSGTAMSGFHPEAVPFYRELVGEFAVCDRWRGCDGDGVYREQSALDAVKCVQMPMRRANLNDSGGKVRLLAWSFHNRDAAIV
ncbi:hypothetical protein Taro_034970 [Colocasia esculenta]|uniref:Uncharacterized protein n=1 Tax=Colocasia esculenta TaxID=4460 RepID=A0A843WH46_COLES|nr:hypothetical protein [Colocasia esculenta]